MDLSNRLIGLELEYSDILAKDAESSLYSYFGYDFSSWHNCYYGTKKQNLDYSRWNCVTDNTIKNSDGSTCSLTYLDGDKIRPIVARDKFLDKTRGIEVISPATSNYTKLLEDIDAINKLMLANGAKISSGLDNALHIHIDANDIDFDTIRRIPTRTLSVQDELNKLRTEVGIPIPMYAENEAAIYLKTDSPDSLSSLYTSLGNGAGMSINHYLNRRIIDIGSWLKNEKPLKTIEFRGFSMSGNIRYIEECIKLSLDIFDYLIGNSNWPQTVKSIDYIKSIEKNIP